MYGLPNQGNDPRLQKALLDQIVRQRQAQQHALQHAMQQEQQRRMILLHHHQQQQQQQQLLPSYSLPAHIGAGIDAAVSSNLASKPNTTPLVTTDLQPAMMAIFEKLVRENLSKYREAFDAGGKSKAEPIVGIIYKHILNKCNSLRDVSPHQSTVPLELPPKERLMELIRSSLQLVSQSRSGNKESTDNTKAQTKTKTKIKAKTTTEKQGKKRAKKKSDDKGLQKDVANSKSNEAAKTVTSKTTAEGTNGNGNLPTLNVNTMRRLREGIAFQQQQQRMAANLLLQQQRQRQQHLLMVQQQQQQQYKLAQQQQMLLQLVQEQEQARRLLDENVIDPITRARLAQVIIDRQKVIDEFSLKDAASNWHAQNQINVRDNIIRNSISNNGSNSNEALGHVQKIMNDIRIASESTSELETTTTPVDKIIGKDDNVSPKKKTKPAHDPKIKRSKSKSSKTKKSKTAKAKSPNTTTIRDAKQPAKKLPTCAVEKVDVLEGKVVRAEKVDTEDDSLIDTSVIGENMITTDISEYAPSSVDNSLADTFSPSTTPPPCKQQPTKSNDSKPKSIEANKWNVEESNLTAAAKRRLKALAPFNSPGIVNKGECNFDSVLGFSANDDNTGQRRSRRTRYAPTEQSSVTSAGRTNGRKRKLPRLPTKSTKTEATMDSPEQTTTSPAKKQMKQEEEEEDVTKEPITKKEVQIGGKTISTGKKDEKRPIKKKQQIKKKVQKKPVVLVSRKTKHSIQPKTSTTSSISKNSHGDEKSTQKSTDYIHASPATKRKLIDRKRRKKAQKLIAQRESKKPLDETSEHSETESISTALKPKADKKDDEKLSGPDGVIPSFLPASVQKALKNLAPHNTPGNVTFGDNAFILNNAIYASRGESRARRRSRQKDINYNEGGGAESRGRRKSCQKVVNYHEDESSTEPRGRRKRRQGQGRDIKYIESEEEDEEDGYY